MDDTRRDAVTSADDTGMIAGEELITEAETVLPTLPREDLHAALPSAHPAHATIDDLHAAVRQSAPDRAAIERHVGNLRGLPQLEAIVAKWWDDPRTQRFFGNLGQIGL